MEMNYNPKPTEPKHLRTGLNMAMVEHAALARLLIAKGVITEEEYMQALAEGAEAEKQQYEDRLRARFGRNVRLA
jgi:SOS response regulatory protein OraA/RecX